MPTAEELLKRVSELEAELRAVRQQADHAVSSDAYRTLFDKIDAGCCVIAMKFDAAGQATDYKFVRVNAAFEQQTGLRDATGRWMRELAPAHEQYWFDTYGEVAKTGKPLRMEQEAKELGRYFDVHALRVGDPADHHVAILFNDITARRKSEELLQQSETQFRAFAEAMPNHVWRARADGYLDWFNSQVYRYSGAAPGELDGAAWAAIVHPDDVPEAGALWAAALRDGAPYETEFRLRRHDGVYRWHISRAVPIVGEHGELTQWIGTNTDIDDQKRDAAALAESETRLRLAIEAGQLAVWEVDTTTGEVTPSAALNRLYGFPDDATPSMADYQARYAPGELERAREVATAAFGSGKGEMDIELRHLWPDGTEKWLLVRAQEVAGRDGHGPRYVGVVMDITERRQVEQALRESERRLTLSQSAAGIAALEVDVATGNVFGSDSFWDLWGLSPRESAHISLLEQIVIPEDAEQRSNEQTRQSGTAVPNVEYRIRRPDTGELRWLSRHIDFVHDHTGRPIKMFGVMQDITERKEAQSRQQLLAYELEHRIKNILAIVSALATQTLRNSDLETARTIFTERLRALANAHDILTSNRWTEASMSRVVKATIAVFPTERIDVSGDDLVINPKMALSLALAVNELGTNAQKYGALSVPDGRVEISWMRSGEGGDETLTWRWQERDGPPVVAPTRRGFGSVLIERVLAADFGGTVVIEYREDGVVCTLTAPVPVLLSEADSEGDTQGGSQSS